MKMICYIYYCLQSSDSTTLHLAAAGGHAPVVKYLLEAGASATDENAVSAFLETQLKKRSIQTEECPESENVGNFVKV